MQACHRLEQSSVTPTGEEALFLRGVAVSGLSLGQETVVTKVNLILPCRGGCENHAIIPLRL